MFTFCTFHAQIIFFVTHFSAYLPTNQPEYSKHQRTAFDKRLHLPNNEQEFIPTNNNFIDSRGGTVRGDNNNFKSVLNDRNCKQQSSSKKALIELSQNRGKYDNFMDFVDLDLLDGATDLAAISKSNCTYSDSIYYTLPGSCLDIENNPLLRSPYRTVSHFGFNTPPQMEPKHFHQIQTPTKFVPLTKGISIDEFFASDKYMECSDDLMQEILNLRFISYLLYKRICSSNGFESIANYKSKYENYAENMSDSDSCTYEHFNEFDEDAILNPIDTIIDQCEKSNLDTIPEETESQSNDHRLKNKNGDTNSSNSTGFSAAESSNSDRRSVVNGCIERLNTDHRSESSEGSFEVPLLSENKENCRNFANQTKFTKPMISPLDPNLLSMLDQKLRDIKHSTCGTSFLNKITGLSYSLESPNLEYQNASKINCSALPLTEINENVTKKADQVAPISLNSPNLQYQNASKISGSLLPLTEINENVTKNDDQAAPMDNQSQKSTDQQSDSDSNSSKRKLLSRAKRQSRKEEFMEIWEDHLHYVRRRRDSSPELQFAESIGDNANDLENLDATEQKILQKIEKNKFADDEKSIFAKIKIAIIDRSASKCRAAIDRSLTDASFKSCLDESLNRKVTSSTPSNENSSFSILSMTELDQNFYDPLSAGSVSQSSLKRSPSEETVLSSRTVTLARDPPKEQINGKNSKNPNTRFTRNPLTKSDPLNKRSRPKRNFILENILNASQKKRKPRPKSSPKKLKAKRFCHNHTTLTNPEAIFSFNPFDKPAGTRKSAKDKIINSFQVKESKNGSPRIWITLSTREFKTPPSTLNPANVLKSKSTDCSSKKMLRKSISVKISSIKRKLFAKESSDEDPIAKEDLVNEEYGESDPTDFLETDHQDQKCLPFSGNNTSNPTDRVKTADQIETGHVTDSNNNASNTIHSNIDQLIKDCEQTSSNFVSELNEFQQNTDELRKTVDQIGTQIENICFKKINADLDQIFDLHIQNTDQNRQQWIEENDNFANEIKRLNEMTFNLLGEDD